MCYNARISEVFFVEDGSLNFISISNTFGDAKVTIYKITDMRDHSEASDADMKIYRHYHFYWEIHFLIDGQYDYFIDNREIRVKEGECIIIAPESVHKAVDFKKIKPVVLGFEVDKVYEKTACYEKIIEILNENSGKALPTPTALRDKIRAFLSDEGLKLPYLRKKLLACEICVELLEAIGLDPGENENDKNGSDVALNTFVNDGSMSLEAMSRQLGYSTRHLSRLIKQQYGRSLTQIRKAQKENREGK